MVRATTIDLLEAEGFEMISAENGAIGIALAAEQHPDLIICDIMMPEMNGYQVLKVLQQNPLTAPTPFIFLSAMAEKGAVRRGMGLGADDYLSKPFSCNELIDTISTRFAKQEVIAGQYSTALKEKTEELNYLRHYNPLTGLPNQTLLNLEFEQNWLNQVPGGFYLPVLVLSLDRFDWINQSLGQNWAEKLLKVVALRFKNGLNSNAVIAHWQLNQFVIIPGSFKEQSEVIQVVEHLQQLLAKPFVLGIHELSVTASIGIAIYPKDNCTLNALVKNAAAVIYQLRKTGGNNYQFYKIEMQLDALKLVSLEAALRRGLERDEFEVYYQPQVSLNSGKLVGIEALVRWRHPQKGLISPAQFIPIAEETGLIIPLGRWVLRKACEQLRAWQLAGLPQLPVAVNLSACQFSEPRLVEHIVQILKETDLDPRYLELEITESTMVKDVSATIAILKELKELGIKTALDDFGTGYSSLSYLRQFPLDVLKIDQSFVRNITTISENRTIIEATIQMAHKLNLRVVAEGVETFKELKFLSDQGCDVVQGYLFSHPVPALELEGLLTREYCLTPELHLS